MPLRQHDVVLADGHFRIVLTDRRRLFAVIDAPETALGPLYIALEIDRAAERVRRELGAEHSVGASFEDIGHGATHAASDGAFKAAASLATTVAPPAFGIVRDVAAQATRLLNQQVALLPAGVQKPIASAARLVLRARLGDLSAARFIENVVSSARSGVRSAQPIGDALVAANRLITRGLPSSVAPDEAAFDAFDRMTSAFRRGDLGSLERIASDAAGVAVRATESLDDYVLHFAPGPILLPASSEVGDGTESARASSRFVQPLARSTAAMTTIVGLGLGNVVAMASDAASGNIAGVVGDAAGGGGIGGSLGKGAAIGAAIGSVIPGFGTAIGGAVGAILGGVGSLFGHHHHHPLDFERLPGNAGPKLARQVADKIRHAPRWQAHFQAIYRHLPAGTANVRGLNDLVAHELFPHDEPGKDATTGHSDGLAEWFAAQSDWETLLNGPGVPPGDRHQLEARIHAARHRLEVARQTWERLIRPSTLTTTSGAAALPAPASPTGVAVSLPFDCHCAPAPKGRS